MEKMQPDFVTCNCQGCDGHLQFERGYAGERIYCPHCGMGFVTLAGDAAGAGVFRKGIPVAGFRRNVFSKMAFRWKGHSRKPRGPKGGSRRRRKPPSHGGQGVEAFLGAEVRSCSHGASVGAGPVPACNAKLAGSCHFLVSLCPSAKEKPQAPL